MKKLLLSLLTLAATATTAVAEKVDFAFTNWPSSVKWTNSYASKTLDTTNYTATFTNASKQTSTITDIPVVKTGSVTVTLKNNETFASAKFELRQWNTKTKTAKLTYSTDGTNFTAFSPAISSSNFIIEATSIPENVIAIQLTFGDINNQVGIASFEYTINSSSSDLIDAELAFAEPIYTATLGEEFKSPQLVKHVTDGPVTYKSENTDVATIDATTAAVTLVGAGTTTITATSEETDTYKKGTTSYTLTVVDPNAPQEIYASAMGADFTFENISLGSLSYVWQVDSNNGYLKGSAYVSGSNNAAEAIAVSPVIDLTNYGVSSMTFSAAYNFYPSIEEIKDYATIVVKEEGATEWTKLADPTETTKIGWVWVDNAPIDLSAYSGKKIQIGFKYVSTTEVAGTWQIKNISIIGKPGTVTPPEPVLGAITINGSAWAEEWTATEGETIVFAAENATKISYTIEDSNDVIESNSADGSTISYSAKNIGDFIISVTATDGKTENSELVMLTVTEKPAIVPTPAGEWALVTSLTDFKPGYDYVITSTGSYKSGGASYDFSMALSTAMANDNVLGVVKGDENFKIEGNTITVLDETAAIFNVEATENTNEFYFNCDGAYLYSSATSKSTLSSTNKTPFVLSMDEDGSVCMKTTLSSVDAYFCANPNGGNSERFASYKSKPTSTSSQKPVQVYFRKSAILPEQPIIEFDGEVVSPDQMLDLEGGAKMLKLTATEGHHIHYRWELTRGQEPVVKRAAANETFKQHENNVFEMEISRSCNFYCYALHPESGLKSKMHTLTFVGEDPTSIDEIESATSAASEWFDLQGRRINRPAKGGVYIHKQGSTVSKRAL